MQAYLKKTFVDISETKYSYISRMFQILIEWMDVFYSCKLFEMLPRKEAAREAESGIFAMQVWEPVLRESPVTLEHFYSSLHWTWNSINAQTEGQAGLGFLVHGLPHSFSVGAKGCGGGSLFTVPGMQQVSVLEQKACREPTAGVVLCAASQHNQLLAASLLRLFVIESKTLDKICKIF